jgi:hypothetical protein
MTPPNAPDPARARFFAISGLRLSAAMIIAVGFIVLFSPMVDFEAGMRKLIGFGLVTVGLFELLVVIPYLIRHWRTPPEGPRP